MFQFNQPTEGSQLPPVQAPANQPPKFTLPKFNKNSILLGIALLAILVTGVLMFAKSVPAGNSVLSFFKFNFGYSADAVAKKSVEYLNNNILLLYGDYLLLEVWGL